MRCSHQRERIFPSYVRQPSLRLALREDRAAPTPGGGGPGSPTSGQVGVSGGLGLEEARNHVGTAHLLPLPRYRR
jgi:hypothetical protein